MRKGNEGCGACCCFVSTVMEYNETCGGGNAIVRECLRVRRITVGGIVGFTDCTPVETNYTCIRELLQDGR